MTDRAPNMPHLASPRGRLRGARRPSPAVCAPASGESVYVRAQGRLYEVTPGAFRSYVRDFGLGEQLAPLDMDECAGHIVSELEEALQSQPKPVGTAGRILQFDSSSLVFKVRGSRILGIRISLRYNPRQEPAGFEGRPNSDVEFYVAS